MMQKVPLGTVLFGTLFKKGAKKNRPQWHLLLYLWHDSVFEFERGDGAARG